MAATLSHVNRKLVDGEATCDADHVHSHRACLVELAHAVRWDFAREGIFRVYDSIKGTASHRGAAGDGIAWEGWAPLQCPRPAASRRSP